MHGLQSALEQRWEPGPASRDRIRIGRWELEHDRSEVATDGLDPLERPVALALAPAAAALAALHFVLIVSNSLLMVPAKARLLAALSVPEALVFGALWLRWRRRPPSLRPHTALGVLVAMAFTHLMTAMALSGTAMRSIGIAFLAFALGSVSTSRRWLVAWLAAIAAVWLAIALAHPPFRDWVFYGVLLAGMSGMSVAVQASRRRGILRTEALRLESEHRRVALEREIEERRRLEQRTIRTEKLESLTTMAGGVVHKVNNLLTVILGNLELVRATAALSQEERRALGDATSAAEGLTALASQMHYFTGRQVVLRSEPLELAGFIRRSRALLEAALPEGAQFEYALEPTPPARVDPGQLRQLLISLLRNAVEATQESGRVSLQSGASWLGESELAEAAFSDGAAPGRFAWLAVVDTGSGMSPETQGRIFDPFFTTKEPGRGLGLAAALGIARSHAGVIHVASREGGGCEVRVSFPQAEGATASGALAPHDAVSAARSVSVLVVDDQPEVRSVARRLLEHAGHFVEEARDGREALARIAENPPAVLLLDIAMPGIDGIEVAKQLASSVPELPIVLMTGYAVGSVEAGPNVADLLTKPFDSERLLAGVDAALAKAISGATR